MRKKIILSFLLLFLFMPKVNAEDNTIFSVKTVKASPGQEVTVQVTMNNNQKFELLSFEIPLDSKQVEFISCDINGFEKASLKNCGINPNNEVVFYALTMYTDEKKLLKDNGLIANIKLKVLEKAKSDVPLSIKVTSYGKNDKEPLNYEVENGYIRINGNIETKVINEKENLSNEVKKKEVTWNSSDGEVASVDEKGNVIFNDSGNATITAIDSTGKIIFEKTFLVSHNQIQKNNYIYPLLVLILIVSSCLIIIKLKKVPKKNNAK